jgi:hypothetical protein
MAKIDLEHIVKDLAGAVYTEDDVGYNDVTEDMIGEPIDGFWYLSDALDIEYRVGSNGSYRSALVMVAFGGPSIFIDTKTNMIEGYWWSDRASEPYIDGIGLDEALEELYECTRN